MTSPSHTFHPTVRRSSVGEGLLPNAVHVLLAESSSAAAAIGRRLMMFSSGLSVGVGGLQAKTKKRNPPRGKRDDVLEMFQRGANGAARRHCRRPRALAAVETGCGAGGAGAETRGWGAERARHCRTLGFAC